MKMLISFTLVAVSLLAGTNASGGVISLRSREDASHLGALNVGDRIEVNYRGDGTWYPAIYKGEDLKGNENYMSVTYDDTPDQTLGAWLGHVRLPETRFSYNARTGRNFAVPSRLCSRERYNNYYTQSLARTRSSTPGEDELPRGWLQYTGHRGRTKYTYEKIGHTEFSQFDFPRPGDARQECLNRAIMGVSLWREAYDREGTGKRPSPNQLRLYIRNIQPRRTLDGPDFTPCGTLFYHDCQTALEAMNSMTDEEINEEALTLRWPQGSKYMSLKLIRLPGFQTQVEPPLLPGSIQTSSPVAEESKTQTTDEEQQEQCSTLEIQVLFDCVMCDLEYDPDEDGPVKPRYFSNGIARLHCDHNLCLKHMKQYIGRKIDESGISVEVIKCPEFGCNEQLNHPEVRKFAEPEAFAKYDAFLVKQSEMEAAQNDSMVFIECARPGCDQFWQADEGSIYQDCPHCHYRFCPTCKEGWEYSPRSPLDSDPGRRVTHGTSSNPISCAQYKQAREARDRELMDDVAAGHREAEEKTRENLRNTTKPCPGCNVITYKLSRAEGGKCNHITCKRCRHEYCWTCLGPYYEARERRNKPRKNRCDQARCFNFPGGTPGEEVVVREDYLDYARMGDARY